MTLDRVSDGVEVRILEADLDSPLARRLAELGLRSGQLVTPLHRTAGGARIVAVGDTRVAVARAVLRRIEVAP
jgi:ferrous iron transport protein A